MKMQKKFIISNIIMFVTPVVLIGVITVLFMLIFIFFFPAQDFYVSKIDLLNLPTLIQYTGEFISQNPSSMLYIFIWLALCIVILVSTMSVTSFMLSKSIVVPIKELTKAANNIKDGNLDFEIMRSSDEDIDELCVMFDEMRKQLKKSTQQENSLKTERNMLLANLSHDLKTPITSIKGYIKGIQDGVADTPDKMDKYLSIIYSKASTIDDMVNHLSMFSKLELSKMQFQFEIGDLHQFLKEITEEFKFDVEKKEVSLSLEIPDHDAYIKIDYEKLYRVFSNLINNSVKYKKDGHGHINITSHFEHGGVLVSVKDDGVGIADHELEKVFDGFYRIDPARNMNVKGSGLGLGIAKQIMQQHGGKLWFQSGNTNGATAFLYFPLREPIERTTMQ